MHGAFRRKFVDYLSDGLPVKINDDEVHNFYDALSSFINKSNTKYGSCYDKIEASVLIFDNHVDYLTVKYENKKIIFRTTSQTSNVRNLDLETTKSLGEAFLGVVLFIETISPSEDSNLIARGYSDKWIS